MTSVRLRLKVIELGIFFSYACVSLPEITIGRPCSFLVRLDMNLTKLKWFDTIVR